MEFSISNLQMYSITGIAVQWNDDVFQFVYKRSGGGVQIEVENYRAKLEVLGVKFE